MMVCRAQFITHHKIILPSIINKPETGIAIFDPHFGTIVTRINEDSLFQTPIKALWNMNDSLILVNDCKQTKIYNGTTYEYIKTIDTLNDQSTFWNPLNETEIIFTIDSLLFSYEITKENIRLIAAFPNYTFISIQGDISFSDSIKCVILIGEKYENNQLASKDLLFYDLTKNYIILKRDVPNTFLYNDNVSFSPRGNFIVVNYVDTMNGFYEFEAYDSELCLLWENHLAQRSFSFFEDVNNGEIMIMTVYDSLEERNHIIKVQLSDLKETKLLRLSSTFEVLITSGQNSERTDWCFISTFDHPNHIQDSSNPLPFENEIFSLKTDGSEEVERIVHHKNNPDLIYSQYPKAIINHKGDKIVFESNWLEAKKGTFSFNLFVVDFREQLHLNKNRKNQLWRPDYLSQTGRHEEIYDYCGKSGNK
jgi:hypothetical protein